VSATLLCGDQVFATVVFRATTHLAPGESLVLVGSVPELGAWVRIGTPPPPPGVFFRLVAHRPYYGTAILLNALSTNTQTNNLVKSVGPYPWDPSAGCHMDWSEGDVWTAGLLFNAFSIFGALDDHCEAAWVDFKVVKVGLYKLNAVDP
jgi:hypothetical protein